MNPATWRRDRAPRRHARPPGRRVRLSRTWSVNGVAVAGATTALVTDLTYAPAGDFARALGADVVVDVAAARVTLTLGAAIVQVVPWSPTRRQPRCQVTRRSFATAQVRAGPAAVWNGQ
jgi:hypothetical protein